MLALLALAVGLAMDSFAVSLVRGSVGERRAMRAVELGIAFGLAQGLMPLLGWGLGMAFAEAFERIDHWIAFILLGALGTRMLLQARSDSEEDGVAAPPSHFLGLAVAAFATSIDAAAAGIALPLLDPPVPVSCLVIGATTAILCATGYWLGGRVPPRGRQLAEALGGVVLIALGTKILIEHLGV